MTILTHFTFESPIRKLCLRCCQSQLGIHFRTPLSGTWTSQGKITAFLVAVLRSAFLHRESGDDSRFVFVKRLESLPSASCPPHDALHPGPQLSPSILKGATSEPLACAPRRDLTVKGQPATGQKTEIDFLFTVILILTILRPPCPGITGCLQGPGGRHC